MSEKLNNVLPDLDAELKQMAAETPEMPGSFHADWVRAVRKEAEKAAEQQETAAPGRRRGMPAQWKRLLGVAAVFVFLIGGTLLTRGQIRPKGNEQTAAVQEDREAAQEEAASEKAALQSEAEEVGSNSLAAPMMAAPAAGVSATAMPTPEPTAMAANNALQSAGEAAETAEDEEAPAYEEPAQAAAYEEDGEAAYEELAPAAVYQEAGEAAEYKGVSAAAAPEAAAEEEPQVVSDALAAPVMATGMTEPEPEPEPEVGKPEEADSFMAFLRDLGVFTLKALPWMAGAGILAAAVYLLRKRGKRS